LEDLVMPKPVGLLGTLIERWRHYDTGILQRNAGLQMAARELEAALATLPQPKLERCEGCGEKTYRSVPDSRCVASRDCIEKGTGVYAALPPAPPQGQEPANSRMLRALELVESVYRQNVVAPGEPSSVLDELQQAIAIGRAASPPALAQEPHYEFGNCPHCGAWVNFAQEAEIAKLPLPPSPQEPTP
jgi:hypothetical protein